MCEAICAEYEAENFQTPSTPEGWQEIAERFGSRWNFHHCCGAIDGKHIAIKKPRKSGSLYYNYKGFFSIVLLAVVDADYKFIWASVGANGSASDCGVFNRSALEPALRTGRIGFPPADPFPNDDRPLPYFLVGDDAFPLREYMVKPFGHRYLLHDERIFNYRCSRARRVVENAFGILANRFRCFLTTIHLPPVTVKKVAKACLCLHNIMRERYPTLQNADMDKELGDGEIIPGAWRDGAVMQEMEQVERGPRENRAGKQLRIYLKHYYNSDAGRVEWQEAAINK